MRRVFLTGGTGTIGSALVPRLLQHPDTEVWLLVRAGSYQAAQQRVDELHAFWDHPAGSPMRSRVHTLLGDIARPQLGMDASQWAWLERHATHLIHCAASVKLNMSMAQARETAVTPTESVLAMALAGRRHQLRKVDIVSTVGVWGRTPGTMPERPLPEVTAFHNTYEAAKSEAEKLIWATADAHDLPVTVHRPSMVIGRRSDGQVIHFQVFYHLCEFLSGRRTFGIMPIIGTTRLDTVPVDWVADAIAWSSEHESAAGRVLHLCSGPDQAISVLDLQTLVRHLWVTDGRRVPRLLRLSRGTLERLIPLIGAVAGERTRRALRGLPPVLAYLAESQGFGNVRSASVLAAAGRPVPRPDDYLPQVMRYYLQHHAR